MSAAIAVSRTHDLPVIVEELPFEFKRFLARFSRAFDFVYMQSALLTHILQFLTKYRENKVSLIKSNSLTDTYCCVSVVRQTQNTVTIWQQLSPCWDQTLVFRDISIVGKIREIKEALPQITINVYHRGPLVSHSKLLNL